MPWKSGSPHGVRGASYGWSEHPHLGALVGPGSRVGVLQTLNHRYALALPESVAGHATGELPGDRKVEVEYGQTLFVVTPVSAK